MKVTDWQQLTLREKIGQTVMVLTCPEEHIAKCGSIEKFVEKYPIGAIHFSGNLKNQRMTVVDNFKDIIKEYNKYLKVPLLVNNELENGTSACGMKALPNELALAACNDPDLAYDYGRVLGMEAKACCCNILNNCVVDMDMVPFSGMDSRSLGDDREKVVTLAGKIIDGVQSENIISVMKHMPAGGYERTDSHLVESELHITKEEWEETNGYVYSELFKGNVVAAMTSHHNLPCMQSDTDKDSRGMYRIATQSKELVNDLIKERLGFKGCILSDALNMGGCSGADLIEAAIRCFMAGHDLLLWPPVEVIDEMEKRVLDGRIPMSRLDDAVSRIWKLKEMTGLLGDAPETDYVADMEFINDVSRRVAEGCLTLVRNESGRIPFSKDRIHNVLIVGVTPWEPDYDIMTGLVACFEKRGIKAEMWRDTSTDILTPAKQAEYDLIIFAVSRLFHAPIGSMDVYGNQACSIWTAHTCDPSKTVMASFGTPFMYRYFHRDDMYINAYYPNADILEAFTAALFGEIPFKGISPVKLENGLV